MSEKLSCLTEAGVGLLLLLAVGLIIVAPTFAAILLVTAGLFWTVTGTSRKARSRQRGQNGPARRY
jgi:hypothetical protein